MEHEQRDIDEDAAAAAKTKAAIKKSLIKGYGMLLKKGLLCYCKGISPIVGTPKRPSDFMPSDIELDENMPRNAPPIGKRGKAARAHFRKILHHLVKPYFSTHPMKALCHCTHNFLVRRLVV